MRVIICLTVLCASASAFTHRLYTNQATTAVSHKANAHFRHRSSALRMVAISNPLKKLPWNVRKEKERETRRLKQEGSKLYRELGVSEDSSFEEIQEATQKLISRYDGDIKKRVKVEICKDKIMQLRLNQRLGGMITSSKDARAQSYLKEDAEEFDNQKQEFKPPSWTRGLIVKPEQQWRDSCVIFFGGSAVTGIFLSTAAGGLKFMAFMLSAGFLAKRGTPPSQPGMSYGERVGSHTALAFGFAFITYVLSAALATAFTRAIPAIAENKIREGVENIIVSGALGLVTAYLHPYKKK